MKFDPKAFKHGKIREDIEFLMSKNDISPRMKKLLERGRTEARKRVVERGLVQFRADPDTMQQLLEISEHRGIPLGTMLREWVKDRLRHENKTVKQSSNTEYRLLSNQMQELTDLLKTMQSDHSTNR